MCARATLLAAILPLACGPAMAQVIDFTAIEAMIKRGDAAAAYAFLDRHEVNYAGDADFDYLFGLAALESGHPERARAALARLLLNNPDFTGARLSLARAYAALGDKARARSEFQAVLTADPPLATRELVARYLAALDSETAAPTATRAVGFIEGSAGRDTNINLATDQEQVFVPLFGANFALPPASVALRANYLGVGAGGAVEHALNDRYTVFAGAGVKLRYNSGTSLYDADDAEARAGVQYAQGPYLARLGVLGDRYYLGRQPSRNIDGVLGEWRLQTDARNQLSLFAQDSRIRYLPADIVSFSGDQAIAGAGWLHSFDDAGRAYVFGGAYGGRDRATEQRDDGDKAILGIRVAAQWITGGASEAFAYASAASGRYNQVNTTFGVQRRDVQYDAGIGINWRFAQDWSLRPQAAYTHNDSNIELYDYNRYDLSITLRRDFR
jgi:tetratricopeptide (TPR) repeat protein